jgi:CheY-specific phosphatase CheX
MTQEMEQRDAVMAAEMVGAARDVLNVMFFSDVIDEAEQCGCARHPIQVLVTFEGDQIGEFRMEIDDRAAEALAGSFLGTDPVQGPSELEVDQVMGELGNMVCGAFLSRFEKEGLFALSSPKVIRPANGSLHGVRKALQLSEGCMDLRVCWGQVTLQ